MSLPPLVPPAAELTAGELARYSRHLTLPEFGIEAQQRLKNARVLVVGAGGLGSPTLLYLAAAGVGTIGIVDFDVVDESNLQRQIIHGSADVGRPKTHSAREAIAELNPLVTVQLHECRLDRDNAVALFTDYDLIIDGTDNFSTRYLVNDAAALAVKPYVWGSISQFSGQISVFWDDAPDGRGINYRDVYPEPPEPGTVPSCAEGGVLGVVCAAVASVMSTEAIKLITGIGEPLLGRLMIFDALEMSYRTVAVRRDPDAPRITELPDDDAITPAELRALLESGAPVTLIDIRDAEEWQINRIAGAVHIPAAAMTPTALPDDRIAVLYCKTGVRSAAALAALKHAGIATARHLQGGIVAWAREFDPDMAMY